MAAKKIRLDVNKPAWHGYKRCSRSNTILSSFSNAEAESGTQSQRETDFPRIGIFDAIRRKSCWFVDEHNLCGGITWWCSDLTLNVRLKDPLNETEISRNSAVSFSRACPLQSPTRRTRPHSSRKRIAGTEPAQRHGTTQGSFEWEFRGSVRAESSEGCPWRISIG